MIKNTFSSLFSYCAVALMAFIVQRVFKDVLGREYLGISGLFTNIMSGLGIIELGFGSAIIANMYKPIAENDNKTITALIQFYKKVYYCIALIVLVIGLLILPFINIIVGSTSVPINVKWIYLFYLADSVVSYFLTFKRSMLYANQQTYYITWIHTAVLIITNLLQIVLLFTTGNYYLYLITSILFRLVENIVINIVVNRLYPFLKTKNVYDLTKSMKQDITKKVKGLVFHKISSFIVVGTDNIIISLIPGLGIIWVGVYSSYTMITTKLTGMIDNIFNSITASVGNLLVEENHDKSYRMFRNLKLINTWIYVFITISFYFLSFPFIELWMGKDFVMDELTVFVIAVNMYLGGIKAAYGTFKSAAGIFYEDRFVPLFESAVNIIASIPFAYFWGLKGVLLGTICSNMVLFLYSYPRYVYKIIFKKNIHRFVLDFFHSIFMFFISFTGTFFIISFIKSDSIFVEMLLKGIVCLTVPNMILILLNYKTQEFIYFKNLTKKFLNEKLKQH